MERESPAESVSRRAFPMPNISRGPTSRPRDQPVEERDQEATRRKKKKRKNSRVRADENGRGQDSRRTDSWNKRRGRRVTSAEPLRKCPWLVTSRTSRATVPCVSCLDHHYFPFAFSLLAFGDRRSASARKSPINCDSLLSVLSVPFSLFLPKFVSRRNVSFF